MSTLGEENERQYRLIDQLLSMHSALRDGCSRLAKALNLALLGASVGLCALVFAGDRIYDFFGVDPEAGSNWLGILAVVVFFLSLVEFRLDLPSRVRAHQVATESLSQLKMRFRQEYTAGDGRTDDVLVSLANDYARVVGQLPVIPERTFARLKAQHLYKRMLSQRIDKSAGAPIWILKARLRLEGFASALRRTK